MHRVLRITPGYALNYGRLLLARPIKIGFPYFNDRGECGIHEDYSRGLSEREIDTKVNNAVGMLKDLRKNLPNHPISIF